MIIIIKIDKRDTYVVRLHALCTCLSIQSIQSRINSTYRYIIITALFSFIIIIMSLCAQCSDCVCAIKQQSRGYNSLIKGVA